MSNVELGFLEKSEPWKLESRLFPSKVGGKPAWLSLKPLPTVDDLTCEKCHKVLIFLCQLYAPYDFELNNEQKVNNNFHRTLFVFVCRNLSCSEHNSTQNIKVFRSSLPRKNDFYPVDPPKEEEEEECSFAITQWAELCNLCGIFAVKKCSQCKKVVYCSKEHQVIDWKRGHKSECSSNLGEVLERRNNSSILFDEWELITELEEVDENPVNEEQALDEYKQLEAEGKTGTLVDVSESNLDAHAASDSDKAFLRFKKKIADYPDQVVRYSRGGQPLLIARQPLPSGIPNCEYCGGPRQFEFQIMPQMLSWLKEHNLDWGVLLIYTCKSSCVGGSIYTYKKEYVFKQDVSSTNS